MIILVGAGGFLGYSLARHFSNKRMHFATISRSFQWLPALFERRFIGSASEAVDFFGDDYDEITVLYMAGSPNLVLAEQEPLFDLDLHLSEIKSFLQFFLNLKSICKQFYFFSSAGTVYGDSKGVIKTEMSELYPKSAYGKRNVALESFVLSWARSNGAQASILRVTNPFGPGQSRFRRRGLIQALIDSASTGQQVLIRGNGYQKRDYIYIDNLCLMVEKLLKVDGRPDFRRVDVRGQRTANRRCRRTGIRARSGLTGTWSCPESSGGELHGSGVNGRRRDARSVTWPPRLGPMCEPNATRKQHLSVNEKQEE